MKKISLALAIMSLVPLSSCEKTKTSTDSVDFEDLTLNAEGIWNGSDGSGGLSSGNVEFPNNYNAQYLSWTGFAYSNHSDISTTGYTNQYSSIVGAGDNMSEKYAVFYSFTSDTIVFGGPEKVTNISVSNSSYAYLSMRDGDDFAKKFGGESENDEDWYTLTLTGLGTDGQLAGSLIIYLADFRFPDNNDDYISNAWNNIDLSHMGYLTKLIFLVESSDVGQYGINTPSYVCIDNIEGELIPTE
ncbi:MAG: DUF4465 domain-containing protein [Bacteroidales bacterium]|nr:DUF4465 domain-containing protein [Bacteroidales bacterium]